MLKAFKRRVAQWLVGQEIDRRLSEVPPSVHPPTGYNPLEEIRGGMFHWVPVPFNGKSVWMELRTLNGTQQEVAGMISLVNTKIDEGKRPSLEQMVDLRNKQERLIRETCNRPRFDDIIGFVLENDFVLQEKKAELEEIKGIDTSAFTNQQKREIEDEIFRLEVFLGFLLPEDTIGFLTAWAIGVDISDIKKLTRDALLEAAILAVAGHDNPTDHISGIFTDRDKTDIDRSAWQVYSEYRKQKEIEKSTGKVVGFKG